MEAYLEVEVAEAPALELGQAQVQEDLPACPDQCSPICRLQGLYCGFCSNGVGYGGSPDIRAKIQILVDIWLSSLRGQWRHQERL